MNKFEEKKSSPLHTIQMPSNRWNNFFKKKKINIFQQQQKELNFCFIASKKQILRNHV